MASETTPIPEPATTTTTDATMAEVAENYQTVWQTIQALNPNVRLVAVSKTKPIVLLQAAYDAGCRCFGENYVQELVEKVPAMRSLYGSDRHDDDSLIDWHFIGTLQSNKVKLLVSSVCGDGSSGGRLTVETVTSIKLANKLQQAIVDLSSSSSSYQDNNITVYVQINTSEEDSKGGICTVEEATAVCRHICEQCDRLTLAGLMTIGAVDDESCFATLNQYKVAVETALLQPPALLLLNRPLELSMGMSNDYVAAIQAGSTNVRVGSTIFGARDYTTKPK